MRCVRRVLGVCFYYTVRFRNISLNFDLYTLNNPHNGHFHIFPWGGRYGKFDCILHKAKNWSPRSHVERSIYSTVCSRYHSTFPIFHRQNKYTNQSEPRRTKHLFPVEALKRSVWNVLTMGCFNIFSWILLWRCFSSDFHVVYHLIYVASEFMTDLQCRQCTQQICSGQSKTIWKDLIFSDASVVLWKSRI